MDFGLDFRDFRSELKGSRPYSWDCTSDFKDFRDLTSEFKVFKRDFRDFWSDFTDFRSGFETFVHRISEVVAHSVLALVTDEIGIILHTHYTDLQST